VQKKMAWSGFAWLASFTVSLSAFAQYPAPPPDQQQGGYPPPQQGGYPPPQQGGYPPPQQGGYPPPQQGGYPPPQPGGYPPPQQGGYPPPADHPSPAQQGTHEAEHEFKSLAFEANPLGIFIGHYSVNIEWMPAMHHALVINPHYDSVTASVTGVDGSGVTSYDEHFSGGGAELGYRFYTGRKGPNGFFVGPSVLLAAYSATSSDFTGSEATNFSRVGFALDLGGQAVVGGGFVIGGGFGLQRTWVNGVDDYSGDLPLSAELLVGGGVRPRFLFAMGYAF
jgi:hypothetical protein